MALEQNDMEEVNRAEALLEGLSEDDKREVVRMAYADNAKPLEEAIREKRAKLEAINARRAQVDELATRVGAVLEPAEPVV